MEKIKVGYQHSTSMFQKHAKGFVVINGNEVVLETKNGEVVTRLDQNVISKSWFTFGSSADAIRIEKRDAPVVYFWATCLLGYHRSKTRDLFDRIRML